MKRNQIISVLLSGVILASCFSGCGAVQTEAEVPDYSTMYNDMLAEYSLNGKTINATYNDYERSTVYTYAKNKLLVYGDITDNDGSRSYYYDINTREIFYSSRKSDSDSPQEWMRTTIDKYETTLTNEETGETIIETKLLDDEILGKLGFLPETLASATYYGTAELDNSGSVGDMDVDEETGDIESDAETSSSTVYDVMHACNADDEGEFAYFINRETQELEFVYALDSNNKLYHYDSIEDVVRYNAGDALIYLYQDDTVEWEGITYETDGNHCVYANGYLIYDPETAEDDDTLNFKNATLITISDYEVYLPDELYDMEMTEDVADYLLTH